MPRIFFLQIAKHKHMISIIAFIVVMFGSLNWLCIGFFQYDLVAGLFGYQGSIFSRIVYIIVGICAIYLIYVMIKNKGRLTVKKLKKQEQVMIDKIAKKDEATVDADRQRLDQMEQKIEELDEQKKLNKQSNLNGAPSQLNEQNNLNGAQKKEEPPLKTDEPKTDGSAKVSPPQKTQASAKTTDV